MVHKRWNININLSLTCKTAQNAVRWGHGGEDEVDPWLRDDITNGLDNDNHDCVGSLFGQAHNYSSTVRIIPTNLMENKLSFSYSNYPEIVLCVNMAIILMATYKYCFAYYDEVI